MKKKKIVIGTLIATAVLGVSSCKKDDTPTTVTTPPVSVEQQWTVSFDVKGGSTITNISVKNGNKISKPDNPQKDGYTFVGWYKESAYNHEWNFDVDVVTANTTLYAKWTKNETPEPTPEEKYSVTYEINGHGTQPANLTDVKALPEQLPELNEDGWTFGGWYLDEGLTQQAEAGATITANTTLYAKWTANETPEPTPEEKYSVTYEINGHGEQPTNLTDVKALPEQLPELNEEGWTFGGWYLDEGLTQQAEAGATITANTTLYAKWTANEYTITFNNNGYGDECEEISSSFLPKELPVLSAEDMIFEGWYYESTFENKVELGVKLVSNITLYAKWTKTPYKDFADQDNVLYASNFKDENEEIIDSNNYNGEIPNYTWYGTITNNAQFSENYGALIENGKLHILDKGAETTTVAMNFVEIYSSVFEIKTRIKIGDSGSSWKILSLLDGIGNGSLIDISTLDSKEKLGYIIGGTQSKEYLTVSEGEDIDITIQLDLASKTVSISLVQGVNKQEWSNVVIPYDENTPLMLKGIQFKTSGSKARDIKTDWLGVRVVEEKLVEWKDFLCNYATNYYNEIELDKYTKNAEQLEKTYNATLDAIKAANSIDSALEVFNNGMEELSSIKSDEQIEAEEYKPTKIQEINELKEAKKNSYSIAADDEDDDFENLSKFNSLFDNALNRIERTNSKGEIDNIYDSLVSDLDSLETNEQVIERYKKYIQEQSSQYIQENGPYSYNHEAIDEINARYEELYASCLTKSEVKEQYDAFKLEIDKVRNDAAELQYQIGEAVKEIEDYLSEEIANLSEEHSEVKEKILTEKTNYIEQIKNASSIDDVNSITEKAKSSIETLYNSTILSLDQIKEQKIEELKSYASTQLDNITDEDVISKVNAIVNDTDFAECGTADEINAEYNDKVKVIDEVISKYNLDILKNDLQAKVLETLDNVKANLLSKELKEVAQLLYDNGNKDISDATTSEDANNNASKLIKAIEDVYNNREEYTFEVSYKNPDGSITLHYGEKLDPTLIHITGMNVIEITIGDNKYTSENPYEVYDDVEVELTFEDKIDFNTSVVWSATSKENAAGSEYVINNDLFSLSSKKLQNIAGEGEDAKYEYVNTDWVYLDTAKAADGTTTVAWQSANYAVDTTAASNPNPTTVFTIKENLSSLTLKISLADSKSTKGRSGNVHFAVNGKDIKTYSYTTETVHYETVVLENLSYGTEIEWYADNLNTGSRLYLFDATAQADINQTPKLVSIKWGEDVEPTLYRYYDVVNAPNVGSYIEGKGYLVGWYTDPQLTQEFVDGKTYKSYTNMTVYPKYVDSNVTIIYKVDDNEETLKYYVENGSGEINAPANPEKEGYNFLGWYEDGKEEAFDFSNVAAGEYTLVARFEEQASQIVTVGFEGEITELPTDEYSILSFVGVSVEAKTSLLRTGGATKNTRYIKVDLSKYAGTASISYSNYNTNTATRSLFISTNQTKNVNDAIEGTVVDSANKSEVSTTVTLECGKIYYLCFTENIYIKKLTVTLDVLKLA